MKKNEILRRIPKIDEVLKAGGLELLFAGARRTVVTEAARSVIQDLRNEILKISGRAGRNSISNGWISRRWPTG